MHKAPTRDVPRPAVIEQYGPHARQRDPIAQFEDDRAALRRLLADRRRGLASTLTINRFMRAMRDRRHGLLPHHEYSPLRPRPNYSLPPRFWPAVSRALWGRS